MGIFILLVVFLFFFFFFPYCWKIPLAQSYIDNKEKLPFTFLTPAMCWKPSSVPLPPFIVSLPASLPLLNHLCTSLESRRLKKCPILFDISFAYISLKSDGWTYNCFCNLKIFFLRMTYLSFGFKFYWPLNFMQQ